MAVADIRGLRTLAHGALRCGLGATPPTMTGELKLRLEASLLNYILRIRMSGCRCLHTLLTVRRFTILQGVHRSASDGCISLPTTIDCITHVLRTHLHHSGPASLSYVSAVIYEQHNSAASPTSAPHRRGRRGPEAMAGAAVNGMPSSNGAVAHLDWSTVPPVPPPPLLAVEEGDRTAHKRELHTVNVGARGCALSGVPLKTLSKPIVSCRQLSCAVRSHEHQLGHLPGEARRLHFHGQQVRRSTFDL